MAADNKERSTSSLGWCMVALQFFLAISWTVYVLFLPKLFAQAGLPRTWLPIILMADQIVFAVMDLLVGIQADRVRAATVRYGRILATVTAVSCAAFLALPYVASGGNGAILVATVALWAVTSAALRVPPVILFARHVAKPAMPWLAAIVALGLGLAAMCGPLLTVYLRDIDPRLPFILSSVALLLTVLVLLAVERRAGVLPPSTAPVPRFERGGIARRSALFVIAILILAAGFQLHTTIASPKLLGPFANIVQLPVLMSIFWVGYNLAVLPAGKLNARFGGLRTMAAAAIVGSAAIAGVLLGGTLPVVASAQLIAGAAWSTIVVSAFASALFIGGEGGAGRVLGLTFASFAVATFGRMAVTYMGLAADPTVLWSPVVVWVVAGVTLAMLAAIFHLAWPKERAPEPYVPATR